MKPALEAVGPAVVVPLNPAAAASVSVIVPVTERPEPIAELYHEYAAPLFLLRFTEKPLRFLRLLDSVLACGAVLLVLLVQRLGGEGIADRPLLLLGVLLVVLGAQAIARGLTGEIIVHLHASLRKPYRLLRTTFASPAGTPGAADVPQPPARNAPVWVANAAEHGRP